MSKLRNVYLYLVCFVTLMMVLFGIIFTVQSITDLVFPTTYYSYPAPVSEKDGKLSEEQIKQNEENRKMEKANQENQNKKNVAKAVAVVLVALPTFGYHWRKIESEKKQPV
ncbi:MAG: hypothetical protein ACYCXJ_10670 [Thermoleophilia bacterium]